MDELTDKNAGGGEEEGEEEEKEVVQEEEETVEESLQVSYLVFSLKSSRHTEFHIVNILGP
jgi:hypothetical protein